MVAPEEPGRARHEERQTAANARWQCTRKAMSAPPSGRRPRAKSKSRDIELEDWNDWEEQAHFIALNELRRMSWLLSREGRPEDLVNYVAYRGWLDARQGFDPSLGPFVARLQTKIRRQVQNFQQLARNDARSVLSDEFPQKATETDPIATWERATDAAQAMRRALDALPAADRPVFLAVLRFIDEPGSRQYIVSAAERLGISADDAQRAWNRIVYRLRRTFPEGLAGTGL